MIADINHSIDFVWYSVTLTITMRLLIDNTTITTINSTHDEHMACVCVCASGISQHLMWSNGWINAIRYDNRHHQTDLNFDDLTTMTVNITTSLHHHLSLHCWRLYIYVYQRLINAASAAC